MIEIMDAARGAQTALLIASNNVRYRKGVKK
jgi:hypothetical protein